MFCVRQASCEILEGEEGRGSAALISNAATGPTQSRVNGG